MPDTPSWRQGGRSRPAQHGRGRQLNNPARAEDRKLEQQIADYAFDQLQVATSVDMLVATLSGLHSLVEANQNERKAQQRPDPIACRAGCTYCCALRVDALPIEAIIIAASLLRDKEAERFVRRRNRIWESDGMTRGVAERRRVEMALNCPLLENGECSVRELRPIDCRGFVSPQVKICEVMSTAPENVTHLVRHPQYRASRRVRAGLQTACQRLGRDARNVELNAALKISLEIPDITQRWLAGESLFEEACPDKWNSPPPAP